MKYFFRTIRWPLGRLLLLIDWITRPKKPLIPAQKQKQNDAITAGLKLYQLKACPFCIKTRRVIYLLGLNIETRDARKQSAWRSELIEKGGRFQVPCLKVTQVNGSVEWVYESQQIHRYLQQHFA